MTISPSMRIISGLLQPRWPPSPSWPPPQQTPGSHGPGSQGRSPDHSPSTALSPTQVSPATNVTQPRQLGRIDQSCEAHYSARPLLPEGLSARTVPPPAAALGS